MDQGRKIERAVLDSAGSRQRTGVGIFLNLVFNLRFT